MSATCGGWSIELAWWQGTAEMVVQVAAAVQTKSSGADHTRAALSCLWMSGSPYDLGPGET
jgi:hypothetical protein